MLLRSSSVRLSAVTVAALLLTSNLASAEIGTHAFRLGTKHQTWTVRPG